LKRRVVITGCGVVTPIGTHIDEYWQNMILGKSGARPIERFNTEGYTTRIAAEIDNSSSLIQKSDEVADSFSDYALTAAIESWKMAGLDEGSFDIRRTGVIIGSSNGGDQFFQENHLSLLNGSKEDVDPEKFKASMINSVPIRIAKELKIKGPAWSISTACASGTNAIGEAVRAIQSGSMDVFIAGGTDDGIQSLNIAGLARIHAMTRKNDSPTKASRPFDKNRDGFLMGAGSGMVVVEEYNHAKDRGANILAEVIGYGATTDAHHITAPHPEGLLAARAMEKALDEAGLLPRDIHYINAHGTGTQLNDQMEAKAIHRVFEEYGKEIPVNAIKSMTGHMLGGSGAVEVIATVLSMVNNFIPRTINCDELDEDLQLNIVREESIPHPIENAMSNSFGFGGHNVSLILRKVRGE
jgi:3-oxoacyl-[acyl-carrier-protein] synthase II